MKTLIAQNEIKKRVRELGISITEYYQGKNLTVVAVLNGAMVFCADLIREINLPLQLDSVMVSSYSHLTSTGEINLRCDVKNPLKDRHVLLVDDIFDTGLTMSKIMEHFSKNGALSVEACCLLNKKDVVKKAQLPKWIGFDIPEVYVIGYGLDADELYRNVPEIKDFLAE